MSVANPSYFCHILYASFPRRDSDIAMAGTVPQSDSDRLLSLQNGYRTNSKFNVALSLSLSLSLSRCGNSTIDKNNTNFLATPLKLNVMCYREVDMESDFIIDMQDCMTSIVNKKVTKHYNNTSI